VIKHMEDLLEPIRTEKKLGKAEVRNLFNVPKLGTIAGSSVTTGVIKRNAYLRLFREQADPRGQGGQPAPLQGRREARSHGLRVRHRHRRLQRAAARRRHRGLRGHRRDAGVPLAEVGAQDLWQRLEVGAAVAGTDHAVCARILDEVARVIAAEDGVEVVSVQRTLGPFEGEAAPLPSTEALGAAFARAGAGDKAAGLAGDLADGAADAAWLPASWRGEEPTR
jgi:hypothetical protein